MRGTCSVVLILGWVSGTAVHGASVQGFEKWTEFSSAGGSRYLEHYVKGGWVGDRPPYRMPAGVSFQMGPARIIRREGQAGREVVGGTSALGLKTGAKPVNILTGVSTPCADTRQRWRLSAWLKGTGTVRFRVYEYSRENRAVGISFFYTGAATPEWKRHQALFEPTSPKTVRWGLVLEVSKNASVTVDDVSIGSAVERRLIYPRGVPKPVADGAKVAVAFPTEGPVRVDGRLDEPCWQRAGAGAVRVRLRPHEPVPGVRGCREASADRHDQAYAAG